MFKKINYLIPIKMLELLLILMIVIPTMLITYKVGRKKKKLELDIVAYIVLGGISVSVLMYSLLKMDFGKFSLFGKKKPSVPVEPMMDPMDILS